jgi:hypothetical protein
VKGADGWLYTPPRIILPPDAEGQIDVTIINVDIVKPKGSLDANPNPVASWLTATERFDFQGIKAGVPGAYVLDIEGDIDPIPPASYKWTLDVVAGTLANDTTATPTHTAPAAEGEGILMLKAMVGATDTGCKDECKVKIYKDCLERDKVNFGTGISCALNWHFTRFNVTISMGNTWNCHGGAKHAYDGSGTGSASSNPHFTAAWVTVQVAGTDKLAYPFSAAVQTAIAAMDRGDVVTYHCTAKDAAHGPGHSATSVEGATTWGSNNSPMVFDAALGRWKESWKWGQVTVGNCAADLNAHWPSAFPGTPSWTMDYIMIHKHP